MKLNKEDLLLYAVTDRTWLKGRELKDVVEEAIEGGTTFLQLREKDLIFEDFVQEAKEIKKVTDRYKIPFDINDNVDVALAVDADGVHIGQSDEELTEARKRLGEDKIIGVSAHNVEEAIRAEANGANYLGVGAMFVTTSKDDAVSVTMDELNIKEASRELIELSKEASK